MKPFIAVLIGLVSCVCSVRASDPPPKRHAAEIDAYMKETDWRNCEAILNNWNHRTLAERIELVDELDARLESKQRLAKLEHLDGIAIPSRPETKKEWSATYGGFAMGDLYIEGGRAEEAISRILNPKLIFPSIMETMSDAEVHQTALTIRFILLAYKACIADGRSEVDGKRTAQ